MNDGLFGLMTDGLLNFVVLHIRRFLMVSSIKRINRHLDLSTLIEIFLAEKQIEGRSKRTIEWYRDRLGKFDEFLAEDSPVKLEGLTIHHYPTITKHAEELIVKATKPIINKGAVSPKALDRPIMVPVRMPGMASGSTW